MKKVPTHSKNIGCHLLALPLTLCALPAVKSKAHIH